MRRLSHRGIALLGLLVILVPVLIAQAPTPAATRAKIIHYLRGRFNVPDSVKITMTDLRASAYPDFLETTVTLDDGKEKRSQALFVSKDMRYMVEGNIFNLNGDPRQEIIKLISLKGEPTQGPANAPVTLVEYSDLECPVCAHMHEQLETELIPKYGDKVRIVFKEYPLVTIHDWAMIGAIASECAFQIDPSKYVAFRSAVYKGQASVTGDHARDMLLHFGAEAGLDNMKLAACIDSKESLPRVEEDMHEGDALGVSQTPTSFINGRSLVGAPSTEELFKRIEEALHGSK